jgi:hypothetical protein
VGYWLLFIWVRLKVYFVAFLLITSFQLLFYLYCFLFLFQFEVKEWVNQFSLSGALDEVLLDWAKKRYTSRSIFMGYVTLCSVWFSLYNVGHTWKAKYSRLTQIMQTLNSPHSQLVHKYKFVFIMVTKFPEQGAQEHGQCTLVH